MPKHRPKRAHQKNATQKSGRNSSHYGFIMSQRRHIVRLGKALDTVWMHVTAQQPGPSTQDVKVDIVDEAVEKTKPENNSGGSDCEQIKSSTITVTSMDTDTVKIMHEINTDVQLTDVPNTPQYTTNSDEQNPSTETVSDTSKHQLNSVDTNEIRHNPSNNQSNPVLRINTNDNPTEENNTTKNSTLVTNSDLTDVRYSSYNAVLLSFFGLKPDTRTELKKIIIPKYQLLPPLELCVTSETLPLLSNCTAIYTSNWPTWLSVNNVRYIIKLFTDFHPFTEPCEIDVLLYKTKQCVGAALIRFFNNKDCLRVYNQMRVITILQSKIKVELDFDGKIAQQIDREAVTEILKSNTPPNPKLKGRGHQGYAMLLIPAPENYQEDLRKTRFETPLPKCLTDGIQQNRNKIEEAIISAMTLLETTNTSKMIQVQQHTTNSAKIQYSRLNYLNIRKELVNSVPASEPLGLQDTVQIQNFLGLKNAQFKSNKREIKNKNGILPPISKFLLEKATQCTGIFVTEFPVYFEAQHYRHVLRLLTDFDWHQKNHFIEILKYSNKSNMGAIFIKFANSEVCMDVYKQLRIVCNLQEHIQESHRLKVQLDVYGHSERIGIDGDQLNELMYMNFRSDQRRMRPFVTAVLQQNGCPALHQRFAEYQLESGTQLLDEAKPEAEMSVPLESPDDDDMVILITQTIPEVDLTEDVDNESTEVAKNNASNNNNLKEECIDEDSNVSDRTSSLAKHGSTELEDDLGELIDQELLDIDINKMIKEDASEDYGTGYEAGQRQSITDSSKQNNKQNENARIEVSKNSHATEATIATNDKQSNAANISIPSLSRTESVDFIISGGEILVSDSDSDDGTDKCKIVYVKNLPPVNTCTVLKELISRHTKFDIDKKFFFIKLLREGVSMKPLGECLLKFFTHEDAVEVSRGLDRIYYNKKYIDAKLGTGHKVSKVHNWDTSTPNAQVLKRKLNSDGKQRETLPSQPKRAKFDNCWDVVDNRRAYMKPEKPDMNTYGFSKDFIFKSGCSLPLSCFVVVNNLHEKVNEAKLFEVFSLAGDVKQVTLSCNENVYMARIEYDHPVEAVQAVSMLHHQKLYDYKMDVSIDNTFNPRALPVGLSGVGKGLGKDGQPVKGVRTNIELRQVHEILYEMGRMNKYENKDQPFQALYTKRTNPPPSSSTSFGAQSTINPKISQALEAFGAVLIALDAIPVGTNCSNLYHVIQALKESGNQKKTKSSINSSKPKKISQYIPPLMSVNVARDVPAAKIPGNNSSSNICNTPNLNPAERQFNNQLGISHPLLNIPDVSAPSTSAPPVAAPTSNPPDHLYSAFCNFMQNVAGKVNTPNIHGNNSSSNICGKPNLNPAERQFNNQLGINVSQPLLTVPDVSAPSTSALPVSAPTSNPPDHLYSAFCNFMQNFAGNINTPNIPENNSSSNICNTPNLNPAERQFNNQLGLNVSQPLPNESRAHSSNFQQITPNNLPMCNSNIPLVEPNEDLIMSNGKLNMNSHVMNPDMASDPNSVPIWGKHMEPHAKSHTSRYHVPVNLNVPPPTLLTSTQLQYLTPPPYTTKTNEQTLRKSAEHSENTERKATEWIDSPKVIRFQNLPPSVTSQSYMNKMKEVGDIHFAKITEIGRGIVLFKQYQDAERCIQLFHHSKVDGHVIEVYYSS